MVAETSSADSAIHRSFHVSVSTTMRWDHAEVSLLTGELTPATGASNGGWNRPDFDPEPAPDSL